jgi:hypothetical protein
LDQTDLDEQLLLILKGGGGMIQELGPDWPPGWGGRPTYLAYGPSLPGGIFLSLLEYSFS